jgi:hypothetical protein
MTPLNAKEEIDYYYFNPWKDDLMLSKKVYHYGDIKIVLDKYAAGAYANLDYEWFEIYYIMKAYKGSDKKPVFRERADFLEIMDTPYKFPYLVVHGAGLDENNYLILLDVNKGLKVVQFINHTTIDYYELKMRNNAYQDFKNNGPFHWFSNPIVLGSDGKYYLKSYEAVGQAKCNACQKYERVLYKFDGKKFQKYKTFVWDENSTKKIDGIVWEKTISKKRSF